MSTQARICIVGAGIAGVALAGEISRKGAVGRVVLFLDDDETKWGTETDGIPVEGPVDDARLILAKHQVDEAIIAMPNATRETVRGIYRRLEYAGLRRVRLLPSVSHIIDANPHLVQTREVNPEDLLGRTPRRINLRETLSYLRGKRVVITGAGGSIGSELARQLLYGGADRLYLFGHGENSLYEIDRDLRILQEEGVGERATIVPIIGELRDRDYMMFIMRRLQADVVFHAAAFKHVPMIEANPVVAIANNVFGTRNLVDAAHDSGVSRFVFISTDKAVDPVGVYGASKALAERIVLRPDDRPGAFMTVRFGNVLGARGSIVPLFQRQLAKGGPVTLTDERMTRFFMTIPEATSLVLAAGGVGQNRGLYALDMGEPVSVTDLAYQLIRLNGLEPERDIAIRYIGARPGERLTEQLFHGDERPVPTDHDGILRVGRAQADPDAEAEELDAILARLDPVCFPRDSHPEHYRNRRVLRQILAEVFPDVRIPEDEPPY